MKFLLDESVDARLAGTLKALSHDATIVGLDHPNALSDTAVLAIAHSEDRTLLTNDRDFGELIFRYGQEHSGVLYFRLSTRRFRRVEERLLDVLRRHPEGIRHFVVVTDHRIRERHSP